MCFNHEFALKLMIPDGLPEDYSVDIGSLGGKISRKLDDLRKVFTITGLSVKI